jgi:hypothetical protein
LLFNDFTLDIGAALAHLDIHRPARDPGTAARDAQFTDRFALEGYLARRCGVVLHLPVTGAQVRQQFFLVVVGDRIVATPGFDARIVELRQQLADVDTQYVCQL